MIEINLLPVEYRPREKTNVPVLFLAFLLLLALDLICVLLLTGAIPWPW